MKERSLGRGISDLIDENKIELSNDEMVLEIDIDLILPNPEQPRMDFGESTLLELADSIRQHGILQPIIVKPSGQNYILVAGERRVRAAKMAQLNTIPTIVREYNSIFLAELAILENLQREDLNSIEEAIALNKLMVQHNLTHVDLGTKIGKSRSYITNALGLLHLPSEVINDVVNGVISSGHARALSKIKDQEMCLQLLSKIKEDELTVRELEALIREMKPVKKPVISQQLVSNTKKEIKSMFSNQYNIKVSNKKISFNFKNEEELKKIMELLKGMRG